MSDMTVAARIGTANTPGSRSAVTVAAIAASSPIVATMAYGAARRHSGAAASPSGDEGVSVIGEKERQRVLGRPL
jgi:hypothetical protein